MKRMWNLEKRGATHSQKVSKTNPINKSVGSPTDPIAIKRES